MDIVFACVFVVGCSRLSGCYPFFLFVVSAYVVPSGTPLRQFRDSRNWPRGVKIVVSFCYYFCLVSWVRCGIKINHFLSIALFLCFKEFCAINILSGPSCSKLTISLVNVSLKFQTLIS